LYDILVVDDETDYRETLCSLFQSEGYTTQAAETGEEALEMAHHDSFSIVVTDMMMDGINGMDLLRELKKMYRDDIEVIMVTGYGSVETAIEAMRKGAFGYFIKGHDPGELMKEVVKASNNIAYRRTRYYKGDSDDTLLVDSKNPAMKQIWSLVNTVAESNASVLITGESGTGKEIVAHQIHNMSSRRDRPFLPINCQSFPPSLIESELFGHEKGAFTGAAEKHIGKLEECNGGTIFLDEIGEMSTDIQVKLLRVLENKTIERIGSSKPIKVDFRVVTATNKDIRQEVRNGNFREDFLYRINTFEIKLPPLRERREDIPDLINCFVGQYSRETGKIINGIDDYTMYFLKQYDYPGNIRELKNMVERMVILAGKDGILRMQEIPFSVPSDSDNSTIIPMDATYQEAKNAFEKSYIKGMLQKANGNVSKAAERMGISRRQLYNKIKDLGL
jgi:DNA-binding NtrC family response regulator